MEPAERVPLGTIAKEWLRLGVLGFGGPPAHISMMRRRFVGDRKWLSEHEFDDGVAATNLLPGPASTQLAIFCAWRLRGAVGALLGGLCFICPGLALILALAALFLEHHPPAVVLGLAAGAGAAIPAVALAAAAQLAPATWRRVGTWRTSQLRAVIYAAGAATVTIVAGTYLVVVLIAAGLCEVAIQRGLKRHQPALFGAAAAVKSGFASLAWVAFKVGALSYGGGFVIIPLMAHDATVTYHWMTGSQFLSAVALGQVTPGPVVQTVAVVGYAAGGVVGGIVAAAIAFGPSFAFVIFGAPHFAKLRTDDRVQVFLRGAGVAVVAAIAAAAVPLARDVQHLWQLGPAVAAALWLLWRRSNAWVAITVAALMGLVAALAGAPLH
jgi:chromate transporter